MSAAIHVIAGPARSGKTAGLLVRFRQALREALRNGDFGSAVWISPSARAADEIRSQLLDRELPGCFSPSVFTFQRFAEAVLAQADEPLTFIGRLLKRQLIERLLAESKASGRLQHFAPIAETPGLVELIAGFISDVKRQEVWPDEFSKLIEKHNPTVKNHELADLYTDYQALLNTHGWYDVEGRFWAAREMMKSGKLGPFAGVKLVVVDGFADFTHTQHEILELLSAQAAEMRISLPLEQETGRKDLFHKPQRTLEQLQKQHPKLQLSWTSRPEPADWPTMAHIERSLFHNPRHVQPPETASGVEIVPASGQLAEIEEVARRIKFLLLHGDPAGSKRVRPGDIAVVFRSVEPVAALVQEVFDEYGIPSSIDAGIALNRSPALAALFSLLRLQEKDWPFRQLLATLSNNYFQPAWPEWNAETLAATEWAVRRLQAPSGRGMLLITLERRAKLADNLESDSAEDASFDDEDAAQKQQNRVRYRQAHALLQQFSKALAELDRRRTLRQWIGALQELADATGLATVSKTPAQNSLSSYDQLAWQQLKGALLAEDDLLAKLDPEPRKWSLKDLTDRLQNIAAVETIPVPREEIGRVRVLSAINLRNLNVPYLFLAGLSEKAFPQAERSDRVYSDAEHELLNQADLNFPSPHDRGCDEMLLFYETITRPARKLTLSYPALDDKAQPLLPSPYVMELERLFQPAALRTGEAMSLTPLPKAEHVCSPAQERVHAVAQLLTDNGKPFAQLWKNSTRPGSAILGGLQTIADRDRRDGFGAFEGILSGESATKLLANRYGPEHNWSVSRLERYAGCPYRYFAQRELRLEELPDMALDIDYGRRGQLAHAALAELHRRLNAADTHRSPKDAGLEMFSQLTSESLAVVFEKIELGSPLEVALKKLDLRLITQWVQSYFEQHDKYDNGDTEPFEQALRPAHFEVSFGLKTRGADHLDPRSTEQPFSLQCGDETIRLSGRIDRIDVGQIGGQVVFNVLDYKTGSNQRIKHEHFTSGQLLQLPLYALAVQELLMIDRRAVPWRVGYWYLKEGGFKTHTLPQMFAATDDGLRETDDWQTLRGTLLARVISLVRGIRSGQFPVYSLDDQCTSHCPYSTMCRIGQVRSLDKKWGDDA